MIKRNACLKFLIFDFEQILVRNGWASSGTSPSPVVDVTITDTVCKASDNLSPLKIDGSLMDCKETQLKRCSLSSACDAIRLAIGQVGSPTWLFSELKKLSLPCPPMSYPRFLASYPRFVASRGLTQVFYLLPPQFLFGLWFFKSAL